jgi:hypothetical protein
MLSSFGAQITKVFNIKRSEYRRKIANKAPTIKRAIPVRVTGIL